MPAVRYLVDDVDRAVAFYTKTLGFTLEQRFGKAIAMVSHDGVTLWLSGPESSAARPMPDGRKPEPGGWNRIVVMIDWAWAYWTYQRHARIIMRGVKSKEP